MSAREVAARVGQVLVGVAAAAAVAEGGYRLRDRGSFPHVNFYVPDARLGVRLRPGATERISFGGNPVTHVRINSDGYRGADLPPPREGEILVVGDSQVFGLGVEEDQTFSARLAALTGRAVGNDGAAATPRWFPGRSWLFGRSHLVFALRKIAHGRHPEAPDQGVASEGSWTDLLGAGKAAAGGRQKARVDLRAAVQKGEQSKYTAERNLENAVIRSRLGIARDDKLTEMGGEAEWLHAARASVGDIVSVDYGEESRATPITAELLEHAGAYRQQLEETLRDKGNRKTRQLFKDWQADSETLRALQMAPARLLRHGSPLLPHVARVKALAEAHGARLVVLILPLDVMVSAGEWAKYGAQPVDLAPASVLVTDLRRSSEEAGVSALDAAAVLAAAEPGAFLDHDLHMTPRGHDAVARTLAATLAEPPPEFPTGALPSDRTPAPGFGGWYDRQPEATGPAGETQADGARCEVLRAGQWWHVVCGNRAQGAEKPRGVTLLEGGRGDALAFTTGANMFLTAPVLPGDALAADFAWADEIEHLEVDGDHARLTKLPARAGGRGGPDPLETKISSCFKKEAPPDYWNFSYGADADCVRTYGGDCDRLLECAAGNAASPPDCPDGSVNAGVFHRCHQLCGPGRACPQGQRCDAWPGAHLCE